jgi:hypothetical protein
MNWLVNTEGGTLTVASDVPADCVATHPWVVVDDAGLASLRLQYERNPVPQTITARQARLWLVQHGIALSTIDAAIASIAEPVTRESVRVEWEYGTDVRRASQWLAALGPALGLTADALDQAFREAATL